MCLYSVIDEEHTSLHGCGDFGTTRVFRQQHYHLVWMVSKQRSFVVSFFSSRSVSHVRARSCSRLIGAAVANKQTRHCVSYSAVTRGVHDTYSLDTCEWIHGAPSHAANPLLRTVFCCCKLDNNAGTGIGQETECPECGMQNAEY